MGVRRNNVRDLHQFHGNILGLVFGVLPELWSSRLRNYVDCLAADELFMDEGLREKPNHHLKP